jgi:hypothetical protein
MLISDLRFGSFEISNHERGIIISCFGIVLDIDNKLDDKESKNPKHILLFEIKNVVVKEGQFAPRRERHGTGGKSPRILIFHWKTEVRRYLHVPVVLPSQKFSYVQTFCK